MAELIVPVILAGSDIAVLILVSAGLAVVFGMMRIVNLAHGEFIMLGGFTAVLASQAGLPPMAAMLLAPPVVVGLCGLLLERLVICHLYGRLIGTMLATWGLSLLLSGAAAALLGSRLTGLPVPFASIPVGSLTVSAHDLFLIALAVTVAGGGYLVLHHTRAGLIARATMQDPAMVASLGISPARVRALTFSVGAALGGLAGGVLAPVSGVLPTMGAAYVVKAFVTVITGGGAIVSGPLSAAVILGTISSTTSRLFTPVIGDAALLVAAILLLRFLPRALTGRDRHTTI